MSARSREPATSRSSNRLRQRSHVARGAGRVSLRGPAGTPRCNSRRQGDFGAIRRSRGVAVAVVTCAISTIIANRLGEATRVSRPPSRTPSSSSPRVSINAPSDSASRQDNRPRSASASSASGEHEEERKQQDDGRVTQAYGERDVVRAARHERADEPAATSSGFEHGSIAPQVTASAMPASRVGAVDCAERHRNLPGPPGVHGDGRPVRLDADGSLRRSPWPRRPRCRRAESRSCRQSARRARCRSRRPWKPVRSTYGSASGVLRPAVSIRRCGPGRRV